MSNWLLILVGFILVSVGIADWFKSNKHITHTHEFIVKEGETTLAVTIGQPPKIYTTSIEEVNYHKKEVTNEKD